MLIEISLQDLMIFLVCALGIVAGILLLPILWDVKKIVGILRPIIEANQEAAKKAARKIPEILDNAGEISSNVREISELLKISAPVILREIEHVAGTAKGNIEIAGNVIESIGSGISETVAAYRKDTPGFVAYFPIIEEVVQILYRAFSSKK